MKKYILFPILLVLFVAAFGITTFAVELAPPVSIDGVLFSPSAPVLNLDRHQIANLDVFMEELSQLDGNNKILLNNTNLSNEDMETLMEAFPNMKFVWTLYVKRWSIRTDAKGFSTLQPKVITHMLDNEDVQVFKYCTDLVALDLGHNRISDITCLAGLTNLRALILVDNPISDITTVSNFHELLYFESFCTRISDYSPLVACENIVDLNISYSRVYDITPLLHFRKLERLWFTHTQISPENREILLATYPGVLYDYTSGTSIEAGWRNNSRFNDMRNMYFKKNVVTGFFFDTIPDDNFDYIYDYRDYIFDADFYYRTYPDAALACGTDADALFQYFIQYDLWKGRMGCADFAVIPYMDRNPDLQEVWEDHLPAYYAAYIKECLDD